MADNDRAGNGKYLNQHILDDHVGKSDAGLVARMEGETRRGRYVSLIKDRNGTFDSVENARDLTRLTIDMNHETVERVAGNELLRAFITWRFGYETGREAYRYPQYSKNIRFRKTYNVGVEIEYDPNSELGYRVIRLVWAKSMKPRALIGAHMFYA